MKNSFKILIILTVVINANELIYPKMSISNNVTGFTIDTNYIEIPIQEEVDYSQYNPKLKAKLKEEAAAKLKEEAAAKLKK